jgi:type I restriction enzyme S subunit
VDDLDGVICGYHLALIRPRSDVTLSEFLLYYLQSDSTKRHFLRTAAGLTRFGLGSRAISSLSIPVPPLGEQEAIAQLLDAVDKALEQTHVAVNRARQLHICALSDAFERLKSVPRRLGEFTSDVRYGTSQASNARGWGNPTLRIPNVVRDQLSLDDVTFVALRESEIERLKLRDGDLLLVRTNGNPDYVGRSAVFRAPDDKTWIYASYLIRVRFLPGLSPDYVNAYLGVERGRRELLRRVTTSAGNHNINSNSIRLVSLPVPNDPEDQHRVVALAQSSLNYIRAMERKAAVLTILKRSLMEDLLSGRVRVKRAAEAVAA